MTSLRIDLLRTDGGTQPRAGMYLATIADYADEMKNEVRFPPVTVFYDGSEYWLSDGFHRVAAAKKIRRDTIDVDIQQGTQRDAILHACGANATHGMRRTNEDKRRAAKTLLQDEEWSQWSDREIARRCVVGAPLVGQLRESLTVRNYSDKPASGRTYTTRHGTKAKMDTSRIGRKPQKAEMEEEERPYDAFEEPLFRGDKRSRKDETEPDIAIKLIQDYVNLVFKDISSLSSRHMVINSLIKYCREISIRLDRESIRA